ncbi:hypothetical protein OZX68_03385 [Streptococcaceae bacterium ESL0729]|nr:hypothetical protein OZX68_03385 [Streptococcaceae bacterium ESL0729]
MILDDLRFDSITPSDWLKVFDPLNTAKMSARYKNKLVVPRIIIMSNYQKAENFFANLIGEDINQFIRRVNYGTKIEEEKKGLELFGKTFTLSKTCKLETPREKQISDDDFITLKYDFKELYSDNDRNKFIDKTLKERIFPRIYPKTKEDFDFLKNKITKMEN